MRHIRRFPPNSSGGNATKLISIVAVPLAVLIHTAQTEAVTAQSASPKSSSAQTNVVRPSAALSDAERCGMSPKHYALVPKQHERHGNRTHLPILDSATAASADARSGVMARTYVLAVNTDGAPTSYATRDPAGARYGLNTVCNGGVVVKENNDEPPPDKRVYDIQNCSLKPEAKYYTLFDRARARRWVDRDGEEIQWDKNITPLEVVPKGRPHITRPCPEIGVEYKGRDGKVEVRHFLVNATALKKPGFHDLRRCDQSMYLDPRHFSALVIPKNGFYGARVGDYVVIANPMRPGAVTFGIVGDTGPAGKFAEGSIALNRNVLGLSKAWRPANYRQILKTLDREKLADGLDVLILKTTYRQTIARPDDPKSKTLAKDLQPHQIEHEAARAFAAWGGRERFEACRREIARIGPPSLFESLFQALSMVGGDGAQ